MGFWDSASEGLERGVNLGVRLPQLRADKAAREFQMEELLSQRELREEAQRQGEFAKALILSGGDPAVVAKLGTDLFPNDLGYDYTEDPQTGAITFKGYRMVDQGRTKEYDPASEFRFSGREDLMQRVVPAATDPKTWLTTVLAGKMKKSAPQVVNVPGRGQGVVVPDEGAPGGLRVQILAGSEPREEIGRDARGLPVYSDSLDGYSGPVYDSALTRQPPKAPKVLRASDGSLGTVEGGVFSLIKGQPAPKQDDAPKILKAGDGTLGVAEGGRFQPLSGQPQAAPKVSDLRGAMAMHLEGYGERGQPLMVPDGQGGYTFNTQGVEDALADMAAKAKGGSAGAMRDLIAVNQLQAKARQATGVQVGDDMRRRVLDGVRAEVDRVRQATGPNWGAARREMEIDLLAEGVLSYDEIKGILYPGEGGLPGGLVAAQEGGR